MIEDHACHAMDGMPYLLLFLLLLWCNHVLLLQVVPLLTLVLHLWLSKALVLSQMLEALVKGYTFSKDVSQVVNTFDTGMCDSSLVWSSNVNL